MLFQFSDPYVQKLKTLNGFSPNPHRNTIKYIKKPLKPQYRIKLQIFSINSPNIQKQTNLKLAIY